MGRGGHSGGATGHGGEWKNICFGAQSGGICCSRKTHTHKSEMLSGETVPGWQKRKSAQTGIYMIVCSAIQGLPYDPHQACLANPFLSPFLSSSLCMSVSESPFSISNLQVHCGYIFAPIFSSCNSEHAVSSFCIITNLLAVSLQILLLLSSFCSFPVPQVSISHFCIRVPFYHGSASAL